MSASRIVRKRASETYHLIRQRIASLFCTWPILMVSMPPFWRPDSSFEPHAVSVSRHPAGDANAPPFDQDAGELLPFWQCHRALVRAKVYLLRGPDGLPLAERYFPFREFNELIGVTEQIALGERYSG